ncbi:MAG: outer membrane beta-barrel protein [Bacteroidetes bacterium]|nr:outer membrane beta-barrel protein [Bacteroidota bacterium]MBS1648170.1 outer membrane beta-barrel protein [Bacteroidota bacterium]
MVRKTFFLLTILSGIIINAESQVWMGSSIRFRPGGYRRQARREQPKYEPSMNISLGYGFPNLDKSLLGDFYNYYKGTATQTGPVMGSIDYQYSKYNSIGIIGTYGKASVSYNSYSSSSTAFTGNIESWSIMLNLMNYMPGSEKVKPYLRTAIGINSGTVNYLYSNGTPAFTSNSPSELAYQVGLGVKFGLSKQSSFFIEAGYGKYILAAGLSFKF